MNKKFKIGEVVQLRSGGCDMTISATGTQDGKPFVKCQWHDSGLSAEGDTYHPDMLRKVERKNCGLV